ncbi:hypothetical protein [Pseudoxanthomonas sp. 10H]|uniref:hypothetical protein n=1 Tax=Pseudoxanthomonas sp. 10H TaxID=3242729 RepID=UPI0035580482
MERTLYSVIRRRKAWHVCAEGRHEPLAVYARRDDALRYAAEAARQRNEIYGEPAAVVPVPALAPRAPAPARRAHLRVVR